MLRLQDIMNPHLKDNTSSLALPGRTLLSSLGTNLPDLLTISDPYINILDEEETVIGAIKTERLRYILHQKTRAAFKDILNVMDPGVIAVDEDSRIFYVNPAYTKILNVPAGKILGRYLNQVEPEAVLLSVLQTHQPVERKKLLIRTVNKYVSVQMHPLIENGEYRGAFSIFTDLTIINKLHDEVRRISGVAEEYNRQLKSRETLDYHDVIGESKPYVNCATKAIKVAQTDATVLLRGENGVGKEIIANIIKDCSGRKDKPFITVNCSAIPESLIESELFGYEEGSFTGAKKGGQLGKFQLADEGTLFLDEIGDMPLHMQSKLLRVLQDGEIEKLGRQKKIPVDVRVITATNKPLETMIDEGSFREDLYYRLNVVSITIPPLRERDNDVLLLADYFLELYRQKYNRKVSLDKCVYQTFLEYSWPGNVRELQNSIESAVVLCEGDIITLEDLPEGLLKKMFDSTNSSPLPVTHKKNYGFLREELEAYEKEILVQTLERFQGNRKKTMEALDLPPRTFYRKLSHHGISLP